MTEEANVTCICTYLCPRFFWNMVVLLFLRGGVLASSYAPPDVISSIASRRELKSPVSRATLDDLREAVTMLEDIERIARRVIGGVHPFTNEIEGHLQIARAKLRARELEHCD